MNKALFRFQVDITHRIGQAQDEGLTVIEIVGTFEAIKAKMWDMIFARAKDLDQDPDLSEEKAQEFIKAVLKSKQ